ncbi:MAG: sulfatase, partial [Planctomycetia bacterium]
MNARNAFTIRTQDALNRRVFLGGAGGGLGFAALASLMQPQAAAAVTGPAKASFPNFPPKAKRIIYLFQSGAPSQMDLFDPKP